MIKQSQISPVSMTKKTVSEDGIEFTSYNQDWLQSRLGKITASQVYKLAGPKGFGDLGRGYIRTRAFEQIAKVSAEKEITTPAMISGLVEEGVAMRVFMRRNDIKIGLLRVQILINGEDPAFSCSPDGIWLLSSCEKDGQIQYDAETIEVKAFEPLRIMECLEAETPSDVQRIDNKSFYQVLDQMVVCNCLKGRLVYWNPALGEKNGGYKEIIFKQVDPFVRAEVKFLRQRKEEAKVEIEKIYNKLTSK